MSDLIFFVLFVLGVSAVARYFKQGQKVRPTLKQVRVRVRQTVDNIVMSDWVFRQEGRYLELRRRFLKWLNEGQPEENSTRKPQFPSVEGQARERRAHLH